MVAGEEVGAGEVRGEKIRGLIGSAVAAITVAFGAFCSVGSAVP